MTATRRCLLVPMEFGVLQVSAMEGDEDISDQDLLILAGEIPKKCDPGKLPQSSDFHGFSIALHDRR
jgi:hypothetical protein